MIKDCRIIVRNSEIVVIDFEGTMIQMPNKLNKKDTVAYVKCQNNKYSLVTKNEYDNFHKKSKVKEELSNIKVELD